MEYDDSLRRIREKQDALLSKAKLVSLSEMDCELCDVEDEAENASGGEVEGDCMGENSSTGICESAPQTLKLYSYKCRCGDVFEILEEELHEEPAILECQSCCLIIHIDVNT